MSGDYCLPAVEEDLAAIVFRTHGEMNPIGGAALLLDELIKHPTVIISGVEQEAGITYHLLRPQTLDIYGATCQVIRALRPSTLLIDLLRAIPGRNDDGDVISTVS